MTSAAAAASSASAARSLGGMEVPIIGSDKVRWAEVTVPSSSPRTPLEPSAAALSRDAADCHVVPGDPTAYVIWRIHKDKPNVLEVLELFPCKEFSGRGLHLVFQDTLHPFAFLCKTNNIEGRQYLLYVLTASRVAYLLYLRSPSMYMPGSIFPHNELVEFDVQTPEQIGKITAVAATCGFLVTGRQDGSVGCYQPGVLDPSAPGFMSELRDDVGLGRLWNLMSRGKVAGAVQDIVASELCGRKLLFVLHLDGILRIWDIINRTRVLNHNISSHGMTGSIPSKLWVGDYDYDTSLISVAVLHRGGLDKDLEMIAVYSFNFNVRDKLLFSPEPSMHRITLEEGRLIDLKFSSNKLWILKEDGSMLYDLLQTDGKMEQKFYGLQEDFVADQLFQSSEHALDDLIWTNSSIFSLMKDQTAYFISSIFLRRLLQPGVHQSTALRATILDHKKYFSDNEFDSLTVAGLKKEIFTVIEGEGIAVNSNAMVYYWKNFCAHFFSYWCQKNTPYGLLVDSASGVIGLIRKSSVSLFRSLEGVEQLIYGSSDGFHDLESSGLILPENNLDCEILFEVLRCMSNINRQLGRAASAIYYESLLSPIISSEEIIFHLLKILETGSSQAMRTSFVSQVGVDTTWEKKQGAHKSQRKFSVDMLLSFRSLLAKSSTWARVLDVIEKYLEHLIPYKSSQRLDLKGCYNINSALLIQATSQIARVMFESAFDVLLLLRYLVKLSGQVHMMQSDLARVQLKSIPMIHEILTQWLVLHFVATTPSESPTTDDFSSRLSSLHIDNNAGKRSWDGKLDSSDFTLACLLDYPNSVEAQDFLCSKSFPNPSKFLPSVRMFCCSVVSGRTSEEHFSSTPTIELASLLLKHGQYEAAENVFLIIDAYLSKKKEIASAQRTKGDWCARLHLLGFCLLLRAQGGLHSVLKEQKIHEAVRCFFRVASGQEAPESLRNLPFQTGFQFHGDSKSAAEWKLHYYQWAMQIFEQYSMSEAACQFALAALEQVDEVCCPNDGIDGDANLESATTVRGRLWANVFKFKLDLKHYRDAYSAIISNPDDESKYICLRRFVNVLCELGASKILCDGKVPFVGLVEKVEQELAWKAERSDISTRPNLYKLLYAFESHRNNWRRAASYMYRYSVRLRSEAILNEDRYLSAALQDRLHGLGAAINALQLVDPAYAWIDSYHENGLSHDQDSPNKKARRDLAENSGIIIMPQSSVLQSHVDLKMLEKEYILTHAQYLLSLSNAKFKYSGSQTPSASMVDALIQENLYDVAFTVILRFWNGSAMKRELERAFVAISQKCCPNSGGSSFIGSNLSTHGFLLPSTEDEAVTNGRISAGLLPHQIKGNGKWDILELYLEKYKKLHPRLPVTVAETLLHSNPQIELPLWLIQMFKGARKATSWGMTGQESDPATLFRIYIDYGRHSEATNLLLEYLESFASPRPVDIINRKKMSAVWFPYTAIERLWCQLEGLQASGHMVDQCDKLKRLIQGAMTNHLKQVKVDSDDAVSAATVNGI